MNTDLILYISMFIIGVLVNVFIKKIAIILFKKDGTFPRIILRFIGIFLIINSISSIFHI